jgi:hypothetical protein
VKGKYKENYCTYAHGYKNGYHKEYIDGVKDGAACKNPRIFIMIYYGPDTKVDTLTDTDTDTVMDTLPGIRYFPTDSNTHQNDF